MQDGYILPDLAGFPTFSVLFSFKTSEVLETSDVENPFLLEKEQPRNRAKRAP